MKKARLLYKQMYPSKTDDDFKASGGCLHRLKNLMKKARLLYKQMYPSKTDDDFKASGGWLHRLKNRHGIRQLSMQGESLSADNFAADEFKSSFPELIKEQGLSLH